MGEKIANYISKLFKKVSDAIIIDIKSEIEKLKEAIELQNIKIDDNEKDRIRWEILDFANSCRNGRDHTKDEFQHIMVLNDKYKKLLKSTNDINGVFDIEYKYISELYATKLNNNDFLDTRRNSHE